jgi:hypothetical protein
MDGSQQVYMALVVTVKDTKLGSIQAPAGA